MFSTPQSIACACRSEFRVCSAPAGPEATGGILLSEPGHVMSKLLIAKIDRRDHLAKVTASYEQSLRLIYMKVSKISICCVGTC
jgi:hypothetical protein